MIALVTTIKVYAQAGNSADKVFANTNRYLLQSNPAKFFVTCWMGILDLSSGMMSNVNAGHNFPVIIRSGSEPEFLKGKPNFVLGRRRLIRYEEKLIRLSPRDKLLLYTDGVTEAQAADESFFGDERLINVTREAKDKNQNEMTINVYEENGVTVIAPEGKIDHVTVEEFESKINELIETNDTLTLDMAGVEYVSSAALRAILNANDLLEEKGGLKLKNVNRKVMEIFNITGFADYLDIE